MVAEKALDSLKFEEFELQHNETCCRVGDVDPSDRLYLTISKIGETKP
jgi:hypothetical protein